MHILDKYDIIRIEHIISMSSKVKNMKKKLKEFADNHADLMDCLEYIINCHNEVLFYTIRFKEMCDSMGYDLSLHYAEDLLATIQHNTGLFKELLGIYKHNYENFERTLKTIPFGKVSKDNVSPEVIEQILNKNSQFRLFQVADNHLRLVRKCVQNNTFPESIPRECRNHFSHRTKIFPTECLDCVYFNELYFTEERLRTISKLHPYSNMKPDKEPYDDTPPT